MRLSASDSSCLDSVVVGWPGHFVNDQRGPHLLDSSAQRSYQNVIALRNVVLQLKSPYRDGTTHIVMSPLEFMQRLAALVPQPRLNLIRFHGILAPNAKHRAEIIPNEVVNANNTTDKHAEATCPPSATRISWARLLKRVFDIDIVHCPPCGGNLKIIAAIEEPTVIAKILAHLGFPTRAPPRAPPKAFCLSATA